jgi:transmembrane sensor
VISPKPTAKTIDKQAADWVARLDGSALAVDEQAALDAWLQSDVRCQGAFARARAALFVVDGQQAAARPWRRPMVPVTRRGLMAASVAGLAGSLLLLQSRRPVAQPRRFDSEIGEVRVIPLDDGSRITLSTNSAVTVDYRPAQRLVRLLRGEAYFEVAKNKARPFVVVGPKAQARAVGTAYSVRLLDDGQMKVLVTEGLVSVERPEDKARGPFATLWTPAAGIDNLVYVRAGEEASVRLMGADAGADSGRVLVSIAAVSAAAAERALLWREGRLSFEGQSLADAVAEFARFSDHRIVIKDPRLAGEHVSGLFAASDPVGFSRAVSLALGAKMKQKNNTIYLYR